MELFSLVTIVNLLFELVTLQFSKVNCCKSTLIVNDCVVFTCTVIGVSKISLFKIVIDDSSSII